MNAGPHSATLYQRVSPKSSAHLSRTKHCTGLGQFAQVAYSEEKLGALRNKSLVLPVSLSFGDEGPLVMAGKAAYELRYFFDWGGGCLWPGNDAIRRDFGDMGPYDLREPCPLPLSLATKARCRELAEWYDTSLNSKYPQDPCPWRQAECDRFNTAAAELLADIRRELGPAFRVTDCQSLCVEDPELDEYLADPNGFRRRHQDV